MKVDSHELHDEFPEYKDRIQQLRSGDQHFALLHDEYHKVTNEVRDIEEHDVPVSDLIFEKLKKQRLKLKDELYAMLHDAPPA
ncbi:MAG: DUF465 domain-containing protein [Proteobacteria bacterium]|nr:DUF465 domain-containing protein [Pseudomonadota bacterium]